MKIQKYILGTLTWLMMAATAAVLYCNPTNTNDWVIPG